MDYPFKYKMNIVCENCRYFYYEGLARSGNAVYEKGTCKCNSKRTDEIKVRCNYYAPIKNQKRLKHHATTSFNLKGK